MAEDKSSKKKVADTAETTAAEGETPKAPAAAKKAAAPKAEKAEKPAKAAAPKAEKADKVEAEAPAAETAASPEPAAAPDTAPKAETDAAAAPAETPAAADGAAAAPEKAPKAPKAAKGAKADAAAAAEKPADSVADDLSLDPNKIEKPKIIRAKGSKNVLYGIAHISATFNNTIVTITDMNGNTLGWSAAGKCGFRGSRKSTAYAAQMVTQDACRQAMGHGLREVEVRVKGPGSGRESAVRTLQAVGLEVSTIKDVTPVPHNGCRPPKPRRV